MWNNIHAFSGIQIHDPMSERSRPTPQTEQPLWPAKNNLATVNIYNSDKCTQYEDHTLLYLSVIIKEAHNYQ
jgi:hypothetical protein